MFTSPRLHKLSTRIFQLFSCY